MFYHDIRLPFESWEFHSEFKPIRCRGGGKIEINIVPRGFELATSN